jgi:hypothetical protein
MLYCPLLVVVHSRHCASGAAIGVLAWLASLAASTARASPVDADEDG